MAKPVIEKENDVWVIRIESNGKTQEYRCASETQAQKLALALTPRERP